MKKRPHICFMAPELYPILASDKTLQVAGGAEVQQSFIARALFKKGYMVSVITNDFGQPDQCIIDGIRITKIKRTALSIPGLRYFHPRLTAIWAGMKSTGADIYYQRCAGAATGVVGAFTRYYQKKFIFSAASNSDVLPSLLHISGWRDQQLYRYGLKQATQVVTQNPTQNYDYEQWMHRKGLLIPSCYALPAQAHNDPQGVILWVGMMRFGKRPHLFLDLAERFPQFRFKCIGGPSTGGDADEYYQTIKARAESLSNVEFLGFVPYTNVETHFNSARLFINTSDVEGFPNTFLQAWARGIPTVSFVDCGAHDGHGSIGAITKNSDTMAAKLAQLMSDDTLWLNESQRCKAYFMKYHSIDITINRYEELISHLMQEKS